MSVYEKLMQVQSELKAPKNQYNSFGKYHYRSCEDILEGVKPILKKVNATLTLSDEIIQVADRIYVKATATFTDNETQTQVVNSAFAREANDRKGQDESQITGTASSYARKYALNGLFCIDDTKDADTDESRNEKTARAEKEKTSAKVRKDTPEEEKANEEMKSSVDQRYVPNPNRSKEEMITNIKAEQDRTGISDETLLKAAGIDTWDGLTDAKYISLMNRLKKTKDKA